MQTLSIIFAVLVAIEHFYIMILEMFFANSQTAQKTFNLDKNFLENKKVQVLFANQGLYNGFIAAGIIFSIFCAEEKSRIMTLFFLGCVIIAAIFGSLTSSKQIIFKQGFPAIFAFVLVLFNL